MENKNKKKLISTKPLSLLITIVHKEKAEYFVDALRHFDINMQMVAVGNGTTKTTVYLDEKGTKAIIFNFITNDKITDALNFIEEKFRTIENGKGVAYTIPLSSVMGVQLYNFLSNNKRII